MESRVNDEIQLLDKYLSPTVRKNIEEAYYEKINKNAQLGQIIRDPVFLAHPLKHVSFCTDHGVVHVRDIAARVLILLDELNGVHFSKRHPARLAFMKGYGAMLAYVHDIGMINVKSTDHDMHAEASAQMLYSDDLDKQLSLLWEENSGNVAWRITQLAFKKAITQPPHLVLREMLALAGAHRDESVAVELLNHPAELRRAMQEIVGYSLDYQWVVSQFNQAEKRLRRAESLEPEPKILERFVHEKDEAEQKLNKLLADKTISKELNSFLQIHYEDFRQDSFSWLISENKEVRELVDDVLDTLRVLRCANASRQRGERLRATGDYQIFLDHHSANAIYAINTGDRLFLMESKDTLLAGEVNLSGTEFTQAGDLRISFYRGTFADQTAEDHAVFNAAVAINEVQEEMIGSFARPPAGDDNASGDYSKKWKLVYILLENCDDSETFATRVKDQLILLNPSLKESIHLVPSLQNSSESERNRYLDAEELKWDLKTQNDILEKISRSGHKIDGMEPQKAFNHVKCADVKAGEMLIQAGTLASFVYIPLTEGLMGYPLGGYEPFHSRPFIPLGNVGVIRGDIRNATIVAETAVKVLMVPKEVYLDFWHYTYNEEEFVKMIKENRAIIEK